MKKTMFAAAMEAFEERYADLQGGSFVTAGMGLRPEQQRFHRFDKTRPLDPIRLPSIGVQLLAILELAQHLLRTRRDPYVVRRERQRSRQHFGRYYVPEVPWEFSFSVLDLWCSSQVSSWRPFLREGVVHPAAQEIIRIARNVNEYERKPRHISQEQYENLSDSQLQRNLIAQMLREWYLLPASKDVIKEWESLHQQRSDEFLTEWLAFATNRRVNIWRADLLYPAVREHLMGFNSRSQSDVQADVQLFLDCLRDDNLLRSGKYLVQPYLDWDNNWQLPFVACVPRSVAKSIDVPRRFLEIWQRAVADRGVSMIWESDQLDCTFRFLSKYQLAVDTVERQLLMAATYFCASKVVVDTSIETLVPSQA